jgi:hypothetical protein
MQKTNQPSIKSLYEKERLEYEDSLRLCVHFSLPDAKAFAKEVGGSRRLFTLLQRSVSLMLSRGSHSLSGR